MTDTARRTDGDAFYGFDPLPPRGRPVTDAEIDRLREDEDE